MKIIKRSGIEQPFDFTKIRNAITKANNKVDESCKLSTEQIEKIVQNIVADCEKSTHIKNVEEIQDMVERELVSLGAYEMSKEYITYRYKRELARRHNTTDKQILSLIDCNNEEVKEENSNKNPVINSVQRDYMAGEVSKDLCKRYLVPEDVIAAHEDGQIHFHDADYFAQRMHNCDLVNLEDMLQNGTVISGTMIEKPHSFFSPDIISR